MTEKSPVLMSRVAKDSYVLLGTLSIAKGKRIERSFGFSLFSCPFFVFAVHSTLFLPLSTIFLTKGGKQNYARLHYLLRDNNASFHFLVSILYTQLFQQLFYSSDHIHSGSLPIPVHLLMDEFANETQL